MFLRPSKKGERSGSSRVFDPSFFLLSTAAKLVL
jgi:hypothetical protein